MTQKPLIGITLDSRDPGGYSNYPWYALRENYCTSVQKAGGIPLPLTHEIDLVEEFLSLIQGLIITGGGHDVDPAFYGMKTVHPSVTLKPKRMHFEIEITKRALEKNMPVFGICGGQQLLNVVLGGTLIQHIPDEAPGSLNHYQEKERHHPNHKVKVFPGTLLHKIINTEELDVNSVHHQAVKDLAPGVILNASTSDGIIEGFEAPHYRFCLGLQWHPEFLITR
ncbi:MAG TPA: gamma-glutamyl-gamma-aminobutyrate hydrolase, partial [Holosporales bacterium]|nr:gamma-glutamyl-gamma-aminobutyrate hydrolase [Holosporales bacterium]